MDVDNEFYMVKFDMVEDKEKVTIGGPRMIFGHYLVAPNQSLDFAFANIKVDRTLV